MQLFTVNVDAVLLGCDAELTCGVTPALQTKTCCLQLQGSGGVGVCYKQGSLYKIKTLGWGELVNHRQRIRKEMVTPQLCSKTEKRTTSLFLLYKSCTSQHPNPIPKTETAGFSEKLVSTHKYTCCVIPEHHHLYCEHRLSHFHCYPMLIQTGKKGK